MFLLQGIVGRHYLLSFRQGWSSVPYAEGDRKGSTLEPFLYIWNFRKALIIAATKKTLDHFTQLGTFPSKIDNFNVIVQLAFTCNNMLAYT